MTKPVALQSGASLSAMAKQIAALPDGRFIEALNVLAPAVDTPEAVEVLDEARDRLRKLKPVRALTLKRIFCDPFEDLLHSEAGDRAGRIPRRAIDPTWEMVNQRMAGVMAELRAPLLALGQFQAEKLVALSRTLWRQSYLALAETWPEAPAALPLIRGTLAAAEEVATFKSFAPATKMTAMSVELIAEIKSALGSLKQRDVAPDAYLTVIAVRLASPFLLRPIFETNNLPMPISISNQIDAIVVDDLAAGAERLARQSKRVRATTIARDVDLMVRRIEEARTSAGRDGKAAIAAQAPAWLATARDAVESQVLAPALPALDAALSGAADCADAAASEAHIGAFRRARHAAEQLGLGPAVKDTATKIHTRLVTEISSGFDRMDRGGDTDGTAGRAQAVKGIRLLELAEGSRAVAPFMERIVKRR